MRLRSKIALGTACAAILVVTLVIIRLPQAREALEYYRCVKREQPRTEATLRLLGGTFQEGKSTRDDVHEFLRKKYPDLRVSEFRESIDAGPMFFHFDNTGTLTSFVVELGCPVI
jgi:hypothetical protein